jgi:hypothetical protein
MKITHIARRQQRNVTRQQLLAIGIPGTSIDYRVRHGRLFPSHRAVYAVGCPPITPQERAMAAVLACGEGAVLSHGSALALWGIWKRWDIPFDVTVELDRRPKGVKVHRHRRTLDRRDTTRHQGIPVTTLARTLLDQAPHLKRKSLNRAFNTGRQNGHVSVDAVRAVVERYPLHPGKAALEHCLGLAQERPTRSQLEDDFPAFCRRYGLPEPIMDTMVCGYEVDALFAEEKVIVELDGWPFHSSRTSFEDDRDRDADAAAGGFLTVRITAERFEEDPDREAKRLHVILAQRRPRAA